MSRKKLKKEGEGKPLENGDFECLWKSRALADIVTQKCCRTDGVYMRIRDRDEHHKLRFGHFFCKQTSDVKAYVKFSKRGTKT